MHAYGPGSLDVIFGYDGDFPLAPMWRPPLWNGSMWIWDYQIDDLIGSPLRLDCRSPGVAARLNTLCATALFGSDRARGIYALEQDLSRTLTYRLRSTDPFAPHALWQWSEAPGRSSPR